MLTSNPTRLVLAGFLVATAAMLVPATRAHAQTPVWSAELEVGRTGAADAVGYCEGAANCATEAGHYGSLSEPRFSMGGRDYTVTSIRWGVGGEGFIHLTLDRAPSTDELASLVLHIGDVSLSLADARVNAPAEHDFSANYTWDGAGSVPDEAATVSVSLTRGPADAGDPR